MFAAVSAPGSDVPHQDALHQDALNGAGIEILQYMMGYLEFPKVSEVKQTLRVSMQCQGQAFGDLDNKVLKAVHPLQRGPADITGA